MFVLMRTVLLLLLAALATGAQPARVGEFEDQSDIGTSVRPGSASFDAARAAYTVTGGGENMWFASDAFHFVWKRLSGDVVLTAAVAFPAPGGNPHRKAGLIIRQSLDPDAPYVDAVVHGDGLTALQFRAARGGNTEEVRAPAMSASIIRLERRGDTFRLFTGEDAAPGGSTAVVLRDPVYVGLAVCSHEPDRMETAVFTGVKIEPLAPRRTERPPHTGHKTD